MRIRLFAALLALATLIGLASAMPAAAACPYTGNTSGYDSSAMVSALNDICAAVVPGTGSGGAIAPTVSAAAEGSHVLKASAGNLYSASDTPTVSGFLLVFDATSAPADGVVTPIACFVAPANITTSVEWSVPLRAATGIVLVHSTTGCFTKTVSTTAFLSGQWQ